MKNVNRLIFPVIKNALSHFYQLVLEEDIVIYHPKTLIDVFAGRFPNKMNQFNLIPAVESKSGFYICASHSFY